MLAVYLTVWVGLKAVLSSAPSGLSSLVPDATMQAELAPEVRLTEYAFRPPQGMVLTKYKPRSSPAARQTWHWTAPGSDLVVRIQANDSIAANAAGVPHIETERKSGVIRPDPRDHMYVVHGGQVSQYVVNEVLFTNIRWDRRSTSLMLLPVTSGDRHTDARSAWVTYDGPVRIDIVAATIKPLNSPEIRMMEQSVLSLRRLRDGESLAGPRLQQWVPDPSAAPVVTPGPEPVVAAVDPANTATETVARSATDADQATTSLAEAETKPPVWSRKQPRERSVPVKSLSEGNYRGFKTAGVGGESAGVRKSGTPAVVDDPVKPSAPMLPWPQFKRIDVSIPIEDLRTQPPRFYGPGIPFAIVGRTIFDLETGRERATLPLDSQPLSALSPDGRWFAQTSPGTPDSSLCEVDIVDVDTGELARRLILDGRTVGKGIQLTFLRFVGPVQLEMTCTREVVVWDVTSGDPIRQFAHAGAAYAVSPDFQYVAVTEFSKLGIHSMATGEEVALLGQPSGSGAVFSGFKNLAFSPDGQQIAGAANRGRHYQVCCWDNRSQVVLDLEVPREAATGNESIVWLPDGASLLLNGRTIIDVKRGLAVWQVAKGTASLVTDKWMVVASKTASRAGRTGGIVNSVEIEWSRIRRGLEAVDEGNTFTIKADTPVGIEVVVEGNNAEMTRLRTTLSQDLGGVLQRLGFRIVGETDQPPLTLRFTYSEVPARPIEASAGKWMAPKVTVTGLRNSAETPILELYGDPFDAVGAGFVLHRQFAVGKIRDQIREAGFPRTIGPEALPIIQSIFPGLR